MVRGGMVSAKGMGGGEVDSLLRLVRGGLPRLPRTRPRLVGRVLVVVWVPEVLVLVEGFPREDERLLGRRIGGGGRYSSSPSSPPEVSLYACVNAGHCCEEGIRIGVGFSLHEVSVVIGSDENVRRESEFG